MSTVTKDYIKQLLATNNVAVGRALVALNARQTSDEQVDETTRHLNGQGFRPCHAHRGTSMAKFFKRAGFLTPKQLAWWRKPMACGNSRIEIYAGQLLIVAEEKTINQRQLSL